MTINRSLDYNRVENHKRGIIVEILLFEFDTILASVREELKEKYNLYGGEKIEIKLHSIYKDRETTVISGIEEKEKYLLILEWQIVHTVGKTTYISEVGRKEIKLPLDGVSYQLMERLDKKSFI